MNRALTSDRFDQVYSTMLVYYLFSLSTVVSGLRASLIILWFMNCFTGPGVYVLVQPGGSCCSGYADDNSSVHACMHVYVRVCVSVCVYPLI